MTLTFQNLIVRARRRIHDIRGASALIITTYDQDGIRWSAIDLANSVTESLLELTRDLIAFNIRGHINTSIRYSILFGTIEAATGVYTVIGDAKFYDILRIEALGKEVYEYVIPGRFFSEDYRASLLDGTFVFTSAMDVNTNLPVYSVYPIPAAVTQAKAVCSMDLKDIFNIGNTEILPFYGIDDLVLDYIERTCKNDEYDMQRVVKLSAIIDKKLQILKANEAR